VSVTFPDLEVEDELLDKALIMPEPCPFLHRDLPIVSVIRPTNPQGVAMNTLRFLRAMGLFIGQSDAFFAYMTRLAVEADAARRGF
jgi:hypothetical protein